MNLFSFLWGDQQRQIRRSAKTLGEATLFMRAPDLQSEHAIETYKSLIQYAALSLKFILLVNGGAAIALLAFLGDIAARGEDAPDFRTAMSCFLIGLVIGGLATVAAYLTQLRLYNETLLDATPGGHVKFLYVTGGLMILGIGSFAVGALSAVSQLN